MVGKTNTNFFRPEGVDGRDALCNMNEHHLELSNWGLSMLPDIHPGMTLDIGCGGGMFISLLGERFPDSKISGIDHSSESVRYANEFNKKLVDSNRCRISQASVSNLPFDDSTFDLVTAVETYFFWPDLKKDLKEVSRVISKGGVLMILAESYPHPDFETRNNEYRELYGVNLVTNEWMAETLKDCGFEVKIHTVEKNNWVVFVAKKVH